MLPYKYKLRLPAGVELIPFHMRVSAQRPTQNSGNICTFGRVYGVQPVIKCTLRHWPSSRPVVPELAKNEMLRRFEKIVYLDEHLSNDYGN